VGEEGYQGLARRFHSLTVEVGVGPDVLVPWPSGKPLQSYMVVAAGIWGGVLVLMFRSARAQPCETPKILRIWSVLQVSSF
jgi:hypothetical protein